MNDKPSSFDSSRLPFFQDEPFVAGKEQTGFYSHALELAADEVFLMQADSRIVYVNQSACNRLGYRHDELVGKHVWDWDPLFPKEVWPGFWQQFIQSRHLHFETTHRNSNGRDFPVEIHAHYYEQDGEPFLLAFVSDITERKLAQQKLEEQALYDALTQLPNRTLLQEHLKQKIPSAQRHQQKLAYLFIDLDHFKDINDTCGHDVGDRVVVEAARRIQSCIREYDLVCRYGGDEFIVVVTCNDDKLIPSRIATDINAALTRPFTIGEETFMISGSIGIAIYPDDADTPMELLKCADQAMYHAKENSRGGFRYFAPSMHQDARHRLNMAKDLRDALLNRELQLYYQPIVDIRNGTIHKAEALLRWFHPLDGFQSPDVFIPIAEQSGLIHEVGDWVMETALLQAQAWTELTGNTFQISVNKSPVQFRRADADQLWLDIMQRRGLDGASIAIEITEGVLLQQDNPVAECLNNYRDLGIEVSIDDFGTGYSALSYLNRFDIDYLKIDKSFIDDLAPGTPNYALCEAIVVMAGKLGIRVIAEGVETEAQLQYLRDIGCDYAQGYLLSRPCPVEQFERLLSSQ